MPIDLTLLRSPEEGGNPDLVLRSQRLRCLGSATSADEAAIVEAVQQCDAQRRMAISDLNMARKNLNDHRKRLRPGTSNNDRDGSSEDAIKKEMRRIQGEVIPELQESVSHLETRIGQELLPKLANIVDEATFSLEGGKACKVLPKEKEGGIIIDPLFCVGGCETLKTINPGIEAEKKSKQRSILTGHGVYLSEALVKYANGFLNENLLCKDGPCGCTRLHCPASTFVDTISSHNLFGCSASCPVCACAESSNLFQAPSCLTPATIHADKSYPDAKLPIYHVFKTNELGDLAEPKKEDIGRIFAHPTERLSILALNLPTLASSRMLQDQLANLLVEFYEDLLVPSDVSNLSLSNRYHKNKDNLLPMIRARTVDAQRLEMNECRRIVIEGYLPSTNAHIELASVCNTSDYVSRALRIKSGGTRVGKAKPQGGSVEHPHIIHGTICDTRLSLAWIMENNSARLSLGSGATACIIEGVAIPRALTDFEDNIGEDKLHRVDEKVSFLPFCRRVLAGKKGKTIIEEVRVKMEEILIEGLPSGEKLEFAIGRPPTKLELEAEAHSSPFGFLPIGV